MEPAAEARRLKLTFHTSSHVTGITEEGKENKMSLYSRTQPNIVMDKSRDSSNGRHRKAAVFARQGEFKVRQSWSRVKFKSRYAARRSVTTVRMGSGIGSCACGSALNSPSVTSSKGQVSKLHPPSRKLHYTDTLVSVWCMLCV